MAKKSRKPITRASELLSTFRQTVIPVTVLGATPFGCLGLGNWAPTVEHISSLDCVSGLQRGVFSPETERQAIFHSPVETCNALLRHGEVRTHLKNRGPGLLWPSDADDETRQLAKELGQTILLANGELRQKMALPTGMRALLEKSGVNAVPGLGITVTEETDIFDIAQKSKFGTSLVVQHTDNNGVRRTEFAAKPSDWQQFSEQFTGKPVWLSRFVLHTTYMVESVAVAGNVVSGPVLLVDKLSDGKSAVASTVATDDVRNVLQSAAKKIGASLMASGFVGVFSCTFYVEGVTGKVFLKELTPGQTPFSQLTHHITACYGGLPLHLLHLAAFMDESWDFDFAAVQKRWMDYDEWTQLLFTHQFANTEFITKSPASSIYAMNESQGAELLMPSIDPMDLRRDTEALFLRTLGTGTYRQGDLETGLIMARGNLLASKMADPWVHVMKQMFNTIQMSGSSLADRALPGGRVSLF